MRIAYFYNEEWEQEFMRGKLPGHEFVFWKGSTVENPDATDAEAEAIALFVNSKVDQVLLDRFPKVRFIAARSTGFDHIDLATCATRGVVVSNVPTYGEHTVAEFAMALLLALSRRIYDAYKRIETTSSFAQDGLRGFDLRGKTIGVIGTGHIGRHMINMAKGFDMEVIAYDAFPNTALAAELGFRYDQLDDLLAHSDVISLHLPYMKETHHLINMENIGKIKRGAFLINTARGGLVETAALVRALEDGTLAGAGLDVLEEEGDLKHEEELLLAPHPSEEALRTLLANHYFIRHPRVLVTAHIAFNTQEAIERILTTSAGNITAFAAGSPQNIVAVK